MPALKGAAFKIFPKKMLCCLKYFVWHSLLILSVEIDVELHTTYGTSLKRGAFSKHAPVVLPPLCVFVFLLFIMIIMSIHMPNMYGVLRSMCVLFILYFVYYVCNILLVVAELVFYCYYLLLHRRTGCGR